MHPVVIKTAIQIAKKGLAKMTSFLMLKNLLQRRQEESL